MLIFCADKPLLQASEGHLFTAQVSTHCLSEKRSCSGHGYACSFFLEVVDRENGHKFDAVVQ